VTRPRTPAPFRRAKMTMGCHWLQASDNPLSLTR
jgi:hypothetical protein